MRYLCSLLLLVSTGYAEDLTLPEKTQLKSNLEEILAKAQEALDKQAEEAYKILELASKRESASMDLYYDSVKEINFLQKNKTAGDYIAWKSSHKTEHTNLGVRKRTNYQVKWLLLAIDAYKARDVESKYLLADQMIDYLDEFYDDLNGINTNLMKMGRSGGGKKSGAATGGQNIMQMEMSKFLKLDRLEIKKWPKNPMDLDAIYETQVLPYARESLNVGLIKKAWESRFKHDKALIVANDDENKRGLQGGGRENNTRKMVEYLENKKPLLEWRMYVDLFKYGSQKEGAKGMYDHIQEHIEHANSVKWTKQLLELVKGTE